MTALLLRAALPLAACSLLVACGSTPLPPWPDRGAAPPAPPVRTIPPPARTTPPAVRGVVVPPAPQGQEPVRTAPVGRLAAPPLMGTLADLPFGPAVAARFPDPAILYHTPGLEPQRRAFTTNAEIGQWLHDLARQTSPKTTRAELLNLGASQRGAPLHAIVLTQGGSTAAQALADSKRPTVLLVGQQHGNAPAASEALLVVAQELAQGLLAPLLERINVIVLPRANPDGAEAGTLATANGTDLAQDHLLLQTPEAQAIAALVRDYRPTIVVDTDEYPAAGAVLAQFGGLERHDVHLLHTTTGNAHEFITKAAREWFAEPVRKDLQNLGLSVEWSHHPAQDRRMAMDGLEPDSMRNLHGLKNAVGLKIASRGVGLGRTHIQRRVHSQVNALASVLRSAAERSARLEQVRSYAERDIRAQACKGSLIVQQAQTTESRDLTLIQPETGEDMVLRVDWDSSLQPRMAQSRARPCGYWLAASAEPAVQRLRMHGLQVLRVAEAGAVLAEPTGNDGAPRLQRSAIDVPAGSYYLPLNQTLAAVAAAALETETPFGYVEQGLLEPSDMVRVMASPSLVFEELE